MEPHETNNSNENNNSTESSTNSNRFIANGIVYTSKFLARATQVNEADQHQFCVDHGLCWTQIWGPEHILDSTKVCEWVEWTGFQKAQFLELVGRRSGLDMEYIASKVGKSVAECQAYLSSVREASANVGRIIDYAEIPAADDMPSELLEPDIPLLAEEEVMREILVEQIARARSMLELNHKFLYKHKKLIARSPKLVDESALEVLHELLVLKIREWITFILRQVRRGADIERDDVLHALKQELPPDPPFTQPGSDSEVEETEENGTMYVEETNWLEEYDQWRAQMGLFLSGKAPKPGYPPKRTELLDQFMRR